MYKKRTMKNGKARYNKKAKDIGKQVRKLNMHKNSEFSYLLKKMIETLPDNIKGSIAGPIYSKASMISVFEARDFIIKKKDEGLIDEGLAKELINLVFKYSTYR